MFDLGRTFVSETDEIAIFCADAEISPISDWRRNPKTASDAHPNREFGLRT